MDTMNDLSVQLEIRLLENGRPASVTAVICAMVRSAGSRLTERGLTWDTATETDVVSLVVGVGKSSDNQRYRLRTGLNVLFPDAQKRWPALYNRRGTRTAGVNPKLLTLEAVLPQALIHMSVDQPVYRLFGKMFKLLPKHSRMQSVLMVRACFSFLYGFLCETPQSLLPEAHHMTEEDLTAALRQQTYEGVVQAYTVYHEQSNRLQQAVSLTTLSHHLHLISLLFCDIVRSFKKSIDPSAFGVMFHRGRKRQQDAVDMGSTATGSSTTGSCTFSLGTDANNTERVMDRSTTWIKQNRLDHEPKVHCFNADEVRRLYLACVHPLEKILLTTLFTTGMRIGGFCLMERSGTVITDSSGSLSVATSLWTSEKGNRRMNYPVGPSLVALLPDWVRGGNDGPHYMFPSRPGGTTPMGTRGARKIFMRIAARANISGAYVHPHTTRHTVAWTLGALGNELQNVADFVGHRSTQVTKDVYIAMNQAQTRSRMFIPWLGDAANRTDQLKETALELAQALAGPFASVDGRTFPVYRLPKVQPVRSVQFVEPTRESKDETVLTASVRRAEERKERKQKQKEEKLQIQRKLLEILS
jgi:hypothetical protein